VHQVGKSCDWGSERAKHMDIRKHFAHEAVQNGHMRLYKIATEFQLASILTEGAAAASVRVVPPRTLGGCVRLRDLDPQKGGETDLWVDLEIGVTSALRRGVWPWPRRKARVDINSRFGIQVSWQSVSETLRSGV
jgi:hypothetical protein